ncbi:hypothetical protein ACFL7M_19230, partial [Thermodesulfobacteriota bacterium]
HFTSKMGELFGPYFQPDFHPETQKTIIAKCTIDDGSISRVSFLPCLINKKGQPEILMNDERGQQLFDYMDKITKEAGLNARYEWEGDEAVVQPNKPA